MISEAGARVWRRRLIDALLLPFALVVVLAEDVVWAGSQAVLRRLSRLSAVQKTEVWLGGLSGYVALPLFLVPELIGRIGELWSIALFVRGHAMSGVIVYASVRLVAALLAVFVYHACEAALLRIRWFAAVVDWAGRVRDWALAKLYPLRNRIDFFTRAAPGLVARRYGATKRWVEARVLRLTSWARR